MKTPRTLLPAALGVLVALLLLAAPTPPAGAHGGEGQVEITAMTRDGDQVTVVARLTYVEDGHGVPDATVTVVVDDGTPVPMEPGAEEGEYTATVPAGPGAAIRVTSVEPATTAEGVAPGEPATDTTEPGTTEPETTDPETTEAPADTTTTVLDGEDDSAAPVTAPEDVDGDSDDSSSSLIVIAIVAIVVVAAVVAAVVLRGKEPTDEGSA